MRRSFVPVLPRRAEIVLLTAFYLAASVGFFGCVSSGAHPNPYLLDGEMVRGEGIRLDSEWLYVFSLKNCTAKEMRAFSVVLGLCDSDGVSAFEDGRICADFSCEIPPGASAEFEIPLDANLFDIPDEPYLTGFFYASRIVFSDGTALEDLFGRYGL